MITAIVWALWAAAGYLPIFRGKANAMMFMIATTAAAVLATWHINS